MADSNRSALIVANGTLPSEEVIAGLLALRPYVLAADGGADRLISLGHIPDAVIGDFDSVSKDLPLSIVRVPAPDQDYTDLDKAIGYLRDQGYETIWLIGATGDRLDHTYGALSMLIKHGRSVDVMHFDDVGASRLVNGSTSFKTEIGQTVSLLALGPVDSITTTGLAWNLHSERLAPGVRDGISNRAVGPEVSIAVGSGDLIVYVHRTAAQPISLICR